MTSTVLARASRTLALGGAAGLGVAGGAAAAAAAYRYRTLKGDESNLPTNELFSFEHPEDDADSKGRKNVIVVGGGVVGVTAAYKLALRGHSVALLESRSRPGKECSACAAGGMQRSNPVVDRGTWIAVTKQIFPPARYILGGGGGGGPAEPYKFFHICWRTCLSDPFFLRWVSTFTRTSLFPCTDQEYRQKEMLKFTDYAVKEMIAMMKDSKDNMAERSGWNNRGALSLSYDAVVASPSPEAAAVQATSPVKAGEAVVAVPAGTKAGGKAVAVPAKNPSQSFNVLEPSRQIYGEDIASTEPSVLHQAVQPTAAKYEYESSAASSERFTEELAERCANDEKLDVTFLYETKVKAVATVDSSSSGGNKGKSRRVAQLKTDRGVVDVPEGTEVIIAAGSWTPHIMSLMDMYCPVYPLKGYAMSVTPSRILSSSPNIRPDDLPTRIVADKYMYTSRLGDEIRITSVGEFSGWSTSPTPRVEKEFRREARRQFPQLSEYIAEVETKCGHRPYVSDGILLLGRVHEFDNVTVSCGPGSNGWKLAMGSGEIVERLVGRDMTEEDITDELGFDAASFGPAGRVRSSPLFAKLCRARWGV